MPIIPKCLRQYILWNPLNSWKWQKRMTKENPPWTFCCLRSCELPDPLFPTWRVGGVLWPENGSHGVAHKGLLSSHHSHKCPQGSILYSTSLGWVISSRCFFHHYYVDVFFFYPLFTLFWRYGNVWSSRWRLIYWNSTIKQTKLEPLTMKNVPLPDLPLTPLILMWF